VNWRKAQNKFKAAIHTGFGLFATENLNMGWPKSGIYLSQLIRASIILRGPFKKKFGAILLGFFSKPSPRQRMDIDSALTKIGLLKT